MDDLERAKAAAGDIRRMRTHANVLKNLILDATVGGSGVLLDAAVRSLLYEDPTAYIDLLDREIVRDGAD